MTGRATEVRAELGGPRTLRGERAPRGERREEGQALLEFALIATLLTMILFAILEFGMVYDHTLSLSYATREGARQGSALVNGGGRLGCGTGPNVSPNRDDVDPLIIAAVQRVLTSPGSPIRLDRVSQIRIYRATSVGAEATGAVNVWTYVGPGAGPVIPHVVPTTRLDFAPSSVGWPACQRSNTAGAVTGITPNGPHSIGISINYTYNFSTPVLGSITTLPISDRTVMAMNPTQP